MLELLLKNPWEIKSLREDRNFFLMTQIFLQKQQVESLNRKSLMHNVTDIITGLILLFVETDQGMPEGKNKTALWPCDFLVIL